MFMNWAKQRNEIQVGKNLRSTVICCRCNFVFAVYKCRTGNVEITVRRK